MIITIIGILLQVLVAYIWYKIGYNTFKSKSKEASITYSQYNKPVAFSEWVNDKLEITVYDEKVVKLK
ncbi:MAG: hypothetical protein ACR2IQ_02775 [Minisyncoccia bacterium]